eukprot:gnl/TRDRNA2_/TRDRNA2_195684_c0_seq1.p1 gnl/TRDRNA2_/TRDRNA2_195684_c0~~gnl/TRDRNA2_/TRDRNA2_195684_c0_seq1.p1  ORF type:complete len:298 (+),score=50.38 gnl/TRDRNA2_/TRDRNA2_195684_c0_seq1:60-896(+)
MMDTAELLPQDEPRRGQPPWHKFGGGLLVLALLGVVAYVGIGGSKPHALRKTRVDAQSFTSLASTGQYPDVVNSKVAYFGCGCFWHVQHEMITGFEEKVLQRSSSELTAFTGYAGGTSVGSGGRVCYHNGLFSSVADYGQMGYAEVVSVELPEKEAPAAAKFFFDNICPGGDRADPQDVGGEYRALVGFAGGIDSAEGKAFSAEAAKRNVAVVAGSGGDSDQAGTVYVMDTSKFPFHQAELYHQFHDDMVDMYGQKYHSIRRELEKSKRIIATGCPSD